jgi:glycosyltransferase involved in cell wall biosynthesis
VSKIAFFMPSFAGGGAERVALTLAAAFSSLGHQVDFVVTSFEGDLISSVPPSCKIIDLHAHRMMTSIPGLGKYLRENRPDGLIAVPDMANLIAIWGKMLAGSPVRLLIGNHIQLSMLVKTSPKLQEKLYPYLLKLFNRFADSIVAVSRGAAEDFRRVTGIPADRISVIYNPFPVQQILKSSRQEVKHSWFAQGEPPVILAVGRLSIQKDYPTLLKAFALVRKRRAARLIFLGQGEQYQRLNTLARQLGIAMDTAFLGFVSNPFAYMARSSVFVLSSTFEGFGNVLVEAMACGTQVVSTDCSSGPREILDNGKFGRLTPPSDPEMLATAIEAALDDPLPVDLLWKRANDFSVEKAAKAYLKVLGMAGDAH